MKKVLVIIGTRPEAIKMLPVINECIDSFEIKVCLTGQHENLNLLFRPEIDLVELQLARDESGLSGLTGSILKLLDDCHHLRAWGPDLVLVHGDTTSSLCGSMYAFYEGLRLCHVESGLRTYDRTSPFPEEANRKIIDYLSDVHLAPTLLNKQNLEQEGIKKSVHIVGNSVIDSLKNNVINYENQFGDYGLVTMHRRENWGVFIEGSVKEIGRFCRDYKQKVIFVTNNNRSLSERIKNLVENNEFVEILEPVSPKKFQCMLSCCKFVVTDSGGVQEEAVFLERPLFILRGTTERKEILDSFCGLLANPDNIYSYLAGFVSNKISFNKNAHLYGDGLTSAKIKHILSQK